MGYTLSGQDNDSFMFEKDNCLEKCELCGFRVDFFAFNSAYKLPRKPQRDISATYDGQWIVSSRFKQVCEVNKITDVLFRAFDAEPNSFQFVPKRVVAFDAEKRGTRFINLCSKCNNYESVVGATPANLKVAEPLAYGIYRTDILFGSGNEKHPLIVVSTEIKELFELAKLKGLEFKPAAGLELSCPKSTGPSTQ